jgi:hypothetical protein
VHLFVQAYHQYGGGSHLALYITKRCTQLAFASDKDDQLLAHGLWFSAGTPASSTLKLVAIFLIEELEDIKR